jgi:hypothetical protein
VVKWENGGERNLQGKIDDYKEYMHAKPSPTEKQRKSFTF